MTGGVVMSRHSSGNAVAVIGVVLIAVVTGAILSAGYGDTRRAVVLAVVLSAQIAFIGFLWIGIRQEPDGALTDRSMRTAIAAATVIGYLVLVGMGVWFPRTANDNAAAGDALLSNFTTIVGIIVAFYFGSS